MSDGSEQEMRKSILGSVEPDPTPNDGASMHDLVIEDMRRRKKLGLVKYGSLLQANNGRNALWDAYEEVLDLAVYLRQRIEEDRQSHEVISYQIEESRCSATGLGGRQCVRPDGHPMPHRTYDE